MRRILVFLLALLAGGVGYAADAVPGVEGPAWFKQSFLDVRDDIADATKAGRKLMLYFYQEGCPYCARFQRETLGLAKIADKTRMHLDVVAFDLLGAREVTDLNGKAMPEKDFAASLNVRYTPTFLVFDETGQIVLRLTGFQSPPKFNAVLDYVATGAYRQYPDFDIYLKVRASAGMLKGEHNGLMN